MAEFPMLPFWTDAYLADTTHLTTTEHGTYLLLLIAMWRTKAKRLPNDDKLLARFARLTPTQWARIKPTIMPFFIDHGDEISQARLTDEADAVKRHSKKQSDKAKARWLKTNDSDNAVAMPEGMPEACSLPLPLSQDKKEVDKSTSKEAAPSGAGDRQAVAVVDTPAKSLPLSARYPPKSKLPANGKGPHWPDEFEAAFQAYPVRTQDSRSACYPHWRKAVVTERVPPERIIDGAAAYAAVWAGAEYRWGFRRWLEERSWNHPVPTLDSRGTPAPTRQKSAAEEGHEMFMATLEAMETRGNG
jgi:uncharacterized protein YdaU (DUF1376 family)